MTRPYRCPGHVIHLMLRTEADCPADIELTLVVAPREILSDVAAAVPWHGTRPLPVGIRWGAATKSGQLGIEMPSTLQTVILAESITHVISQGDWPDFSSTRLPPEGARGLILFPLKGHMGVSQ